MSAALESQQCPLLLGGGSFLHRDLRKGRTPEGSLNTHGEGFPTRDGVTGQGNGF